MDLIKKLRIKFALNAMIIAAIFLLVMFGAVYGLLWSNDVSTEKRMLTDAASMPFMPGGAVVKEDLVYTFVINGTTIEMTNATEFLNQYGDDANGIVSAAIEQENGIFKYDFIVFFTG